MVYKICGDLVLFLTIMFLKPQAEGRGFGIVIP